MEPQERANSPTQQATGQCNVCYNQPPVNAAQLDCGHVFCFLCIKSVAEITGVCPMCRAEIGLDFQFREHDILGSVRVPSESARDGRYWFYEGYRGWWLYDAETSKDLDEAYWSGVKTVEKFIAGSIYVIDLENMSQCRKDGDGRSRKICRATLDLENILGMSGLKGRDFRELLDIMRSS